MVSLEYFQTPEARAPVFFLFLWRLWRQKAKKYGVRFRFRRQGVKTVIKQIVIKTVRHIPNFCENNAV